MEYFLVVILRFIRLITFISVHSFLLFSRVPFGGKKKALCAFYPGSSSSTVDFSFEYQHQFDGMNIERGLASLRD